MSMQIHKQYRSVALAILCALASMLLAGCHRASVSSSGGSDAGAPVMFGSYSPPYATIQISVNSGGQQTGGITVAHSDSIQLSGQSTVGWSNQKWEIYEYPSGFGAPAGWSTDSAGAYYSTAVSPPSFTIPSSAAVWGKWMLRLRINDALSNSSAAQKFTDEAAALRVLSSHGLRNIGAGETNQFNRSWAKELQSDLLIVDGILDGGVGSGSGSSCAVADFAALRAIASSARVDGGGCSVASPVGPWVFSSTTGAGFADDGATVIKPTDVLVGTNGRWYNGTGPIVPTLAALRLAVAGKHPTVQVQARAALGDGGGDLFDLDTSDTTTADNDITVIVAGSQRYRRRGAGRIDIRWAGARPALSVTCLASNDTCTTSSKHGWVNGTTVRLAYKRGAVVGLLPGGLTQGTTYYVRDASTATFKLETAPSAGAINLTTDTAGINFVAPVSYTVANTSAIQAAGNLAHAQGGGTVYVPGGFYPITLPDAVPPTVTALLFDQIRNVTFEGDGKYVSGFYDTTASASVSIGAGNDAGANAFITISRSANIHIRRLGFIGAALWGQTRINVGCVVIKKGLAFLGIGADPTTGNVNTSVTDNYFERIEGETVFADTVPANIDWSDNHVFNNICNAFNTSGGSTGFTDVRVVRNKIENIAQSAFQLNGNNVVYSDNVATWDSTGGLYSVGTVGVAETIQAGRIERNTFDGFNPPATLSIIHVGIQGATDNLSIVGNKIQNCTLPFDSGNTNAFISISNTASGGPVDLTNLTVERNEFNNDTGTTSTLATIPAIRVHGVTGRRTGGRIGKNSVRGGNVDTGVWLDTTVDGANAWTVDKQDFFLNPGRGQRFDVDPFGDRAQRQTIAGTATAEVLADLLYKLEVAGIVYDGTYNVANDVTSQSILLWLDGTRGITLGGTMRASGTSPPALTLTGTLTNAIGLCVDLDSGGARGTASFSWSVDNCRTFVATGVTTAATVALSGTATGITLNFASGTYNANNLYQATVAQWDDQSGGAHHVAQGTAGLQPLYDAAAKNARGGLTFDATDDRLGVAIGGMTQPIAAYVAFKFNATNDNATLFDGNSAATMRFARTTTATPGVDGLLLCSDGAGSAFIFSTACTPEQFHADRLFFSGSSSSIREDKASRGTGNPGTSAPGGITVGNLAGGGLPSNATILELQVYPGALSTSDDARVLSSLRAKWDLFHAPANDNDDVFAPGRDHSGGWSHNHYGDLSEAVGF